MKTQEKEPPQNSNFDSYEKAYHEIDATYPNFWRWVGISLLAILFLFALPYLLEHTTKTVKAYKGLREVVRG